MYRSQHGAAQDRHPAHRARPRRLADQRGGLGARRQGTDRARRPAGDEARPAGARRRCARGRRAPPLRLTRRAEARARPRRPRDRRRGPLLPRRRRLHGGLHRLPAAARRRAGDRPRRRPRAARLGASQRPTRARDRAQERACSWRPPISRTGQTWRRSTSPSSRWPRCCPRSPACLAPGGEILALVKPQFELGRGRVRGGVVRSADERREALVSVARGRSADRPRVQGICVVRAPRAEGQPGDLRLVRRRGPGRTRTSRSAAREVEP